MFTVGEYLLRSSASIEQTFGGITTRLWDDPFEWTLPEKLSTKPSIFEYFEEVRRVTASGFRFISNDEALSRAIPAPTAIKPIAQVLIETLSRADHYQGRSFAIFQMLSDEKLPRIK